MNNLKEFKELIERYESITLEEIEGYIRGDNKSIQLYLTVLTGFGLASTCTLCKSVEQNCNKCVYAYSVDAPLDYIYDRYKHPCYFGDNEETYYNINFAKTSDELLQAYKARAKHMRNILKEIDNDSKRI